MLRDFGLGAAAGTVVPVIALIRPPDCLSALIVAAAGGGGFILALRLQS